MGEEAEDESAARDREELEAAKVELIVLNKQANKDAVATARVLLRVHDGAHFKGAGFETVQDWAESEVNMPRSTVSLHLRVGRACSPSLIRKHGPSKLDAALSYAKAHALTRGPIDIEQAQITVEGDDGQATTMPLLDASVRQLRQATASARKESRHASRHPGQKAAEQMREHLNQKLAEANVRGGRVKETWSPGKKEWIFSVTGVEKQQLYLAMCVLAKHSRVD